MIFLGLSLTTYLQIQLPFFWPAAIIRLVGSSVTQYTILNKLPISIISSNPLAFRQWTTSWIIGPRTIDKCTIQHLSSEHMAVDTGFQRNAESCMTTKMHFHMLSPCKGQHCTSSNLKETPRLRNCASALYVSLHPMIPHPHNHYKSFLKSFNLCNSK